MPVTFVTRRLRAMATMPDRLLWAVRVRWLVIAGFFALAAAARLAGGLTSLRPCAIAAVVGLVLNSVNHLCVTRRRYIVAATAVAIPLDHVLITYVVVNTGGVASPFIMMYFVQVVTTAMLVDAGVAVASAGLAVVAWLVGLGLAGGMATNPILPHRETAPALAFRSMWAVFLIYCLGLLVYIGGYLGQRLRSSEADLAEKNARLTSTLTSLQAAYEKLKQTESWLVHSEKMRSLGQLVAGVAHELNNPVSFISANVEHLTTYMERLAAAVQAYAEVELSPEARRRIEGIRSELRLERVLDDLPGLLADCEEGARRSKEIVAQLRSFSRNDEVAQWRKTDLRLELDRTLALLGHRLKDGVQIHRDYGDVADVECVPGQINQVFMNIIANAADAIGGRSGNLWVHVSHADAAGQGRVRVTVRDDGAGMTSDVSSRIFEPFFTTKDVGQGTGLGLAVSYAIIRRHNGQIAVESSAGVGTTFSVTLPTQRAAGGATPSDASVFTGAPQAAPAARKSPVDSGDIPGYFDSDASSSHRGDTSDGKSPRR